MKDFNEFDTAQRRNQIVTKELIKRGGFHLYGPNDSAMEAEISAGVSAAMIVLREYHEWLTGNL